MASTWTKNMLPCQFVDFSDQIYILLSPWNPSTVLTDPLPTPHSPLRRERVGGYRSPSTRGRFRPGRHPPPAPLGSIYLCRSSLPPRVVAPPLHWPPPSSGSIGVAWGGPSREMRWGGMALVGCSRTSTGTPARRNRKATGHCGPRTVRALRRHRVLRLLQLQVASNARIQVLPATTPNPIWKLLCTLSVPYFLNPSCRIWDMRLWYFPIWGMTWSHKE